MNNVSRIFCATFVAAFVFGFIDNVILVLAGDAIDKTLAASFGFSTMFSAGLGNAISDGVGELAGGAIGAMVYMLLGTSEEDNESVPHSVVAVAGVTGIVTGCLFGMFPLIWM